MSKIIVIGGGVMASAFAVAQAASHEVSIIPTPFDQDSITNIKETGKDIRLDVVWPNIGFVSPEDVKDFDLIVIGVSSAGIAWAVNIVRALANTKHVPVVLLTKGLIKSAERLDPLSLYVESELGMDVLSITGPCIAKELAHQRVTHIELSGRDMLVAEAVKKIVQKPYYHIQLNDDYIGCQWGAALKNVYAILVGKSGHNVNLRSGIFAHSLQEMAAWIEESGGRATTALGLSGAGDLYVTCQGGRNGRLGSLIAEGLSIEAITSGPMKGVTVEGLDLAYDLLPLNISKSKPLFQELVEIL